MAGTVLGKRSRILVDSPDTETARTTRSKRRAQFVVLDNSEKENPFISRNKKSPKNDDCMDLDDLAVEEATPSRKLRTASGTPAKHISAESRLSVSPIKISSHFKATKPISTSVGKPDTVKTPSTPRHRDALATKVAVTPKHRVLVAGKPLTPRTPRTLFTPRSTVPTVYNEARQIFSRGAEVTSLYGRESERKELRDFVSSRIANNSSGCVYVSGPPGTGKSAFVNDVCAEFKTTSEIKSAYINCMSVKGAADIYGKLVEEFIDDIEDVEEESATQALRSLFRKSGASYLVTLDEIDYLLDIDLELLYNLFEWSLQPNSNLILVGIANALDFTDRFLPRLKARGLKPHLLPFLPYTAAQIASVIISKLKSLLPSDGTQDYVPFIHPTAIQFLSKKVASQSGDLRKTFDICRRAIDLIESDTRDQHAKTAGELLPSPSPSPSKTPLVDNINLSSPPMRAQKPAMTDPVAKSLGQLTAYTAPRATIAHMARITAAVFSNGTTQRLQSLNLQQKAVLCALCALEGKQRAAASLLNEGIASTPSKHQNAAPTVKQIFEAYTTICKANNILHPLTATEFRDIIGSLEVLSLVSAVEGKAGSLTAVATPSRRGRGGFGGTTVDERRIAGVVGKNELASSFSGAGSAILKSILEGEEL